MAQADEDELHPDIAAAMDDVLDGAAIDARLRERLRTLITNCLADNFVDSDVRAVIDLAASLEKEGEDGA